MCRDDQSADRGTAARFFMRDGLFQVEYAPGGFTIHELRGSVGQVMRQVGTDHDQRLVAAPDRFKYFRDFCCCRHADRQRQQCEIFQYALQEGQLYLQRVFLRMRFLADDHLGHLCDCTHRFGIEHHPPKRCFKRFGIGQRQSLHCDPMSGAEQNHAPDERSNIFQAWHRHLRQSGRNRRIRHVARSRPWGSRTAHVHCCKKSRTSSAS